MRTMAQVLAAGLAVLASGAQAQWIQMKGDDDPFAGRGAPLIALSMSPIGTTVAFRCTSVEDLAMILVTPERPDEDTRAVFGLVKIKLLVIVDDQPKVSLEASAAVTPDGKQIRYETDEDGVIEVLHAVAGAKRRVAVAVEVMGKAFYSQSYQATNSRRALQPLIAGCKLPAAGGKAKVN